MACIDQRLHLCAPEQQGAASQRRRLHNRNGRVGMSAAQGFDLGEIRPALPRAYRFVIGDNAEIAIL